MISSENRASKNIRHVTKEVIEIAMKKTRSNMEAARFIGVSFNTYKKYASLFYNEEGISLYEKHKNQSGLGVKKRGLHSTHYNALRDAVTGRAEVSEIKTRYFKERLISEGFKLEKCDRCQFNEKRELDNKAPLLLYFIDGNKKNWLIYNLEFLCYNCYFLTIGDVFKKSQLKSLESYEFSCGTKFDFELPEEQKEIVEKSVNLQNKFTNQNLLNDPIRNREFDKLEKEYLKDIISYLK